MINMASFYYKLMLFRAVYACKNVINKLLIESGISPSNLINDL